MVSVRQEAFYKWSAATLLFAALFVAASYVGARYFGSLGRVEATPETARRLQGAFESVAAKAAPAVVVISAEVRDMANAPPANPYEEWLRRLYEERMGGGEDRETPENMARGSGFVIRPDGYILTNYHVVRDASRVKVALIDEREYEASVVGVDPKTDLAVLKIAPENPLPSLSFAAPESVKVGHWAMAIGAPFNLEYTVTVGIVSHLGRAVGMNAYENYIQTDASVNPGNSGGPLLNLQGEVIGVNDFILTSAGRGSIGLSFAVSCALAKDISGQLIANGKIDRPWLGVAMGKLTPEARRRGRFAADDQVLVTGVQPGGPAALADVRPGDVILAVGDKTTRDVQAVQFAILKFKPGDTIPLRLRRNGEVLQVNVAAGKQHAMTLNADAPPRTSWDGNDLFGRFGFSLGEQNGETIVLEVVSGSVAARAGLAPGMVVLGVNRRPVRGVRDAAIIAALAFEREKSLLLYVSDGQTRRFVSLSLN